MVAILGGPFDPLATTPIILPDSILPGRSDLDAAVLECKSGIKCFHETLSYPGHNMESSNALREKV